MPDNPLLDFAGLPRFGEIRAEHVLPAVDTLIAEARAAENVTPSAGLVLPKRARP